MDAVLGWNLLLSLPVILAIARLAGRLLGGAPAIEDRAALSLSNNSVMVVRFGHSV
jgi:hypothetical protein